VAARVVTGIEVVVFDLFGTFAFEFPQPIGTRGSRRAPRCSTPMSTRSEPDGRRRPGQFLPVSGYDE